MPRTTTRYGITVPVGGDNNNIPTDIGAVADGFDTIVATAYAGLAAARPAAGMLGRFWKSTDTGELDFDTGATWLRVGQYTDGVQVLTTTARLALAGAQLWTGLTVYDSTARSLFVYDGAAWNQSGGGGGFARTFMYLGS